MSSVAPVIALTCIGVARLPYLPSFPTSKTGITWDASGKHTCFAMCSEANPQRICTFASSDSKDRPTLSTPKSVIGGRLNNSVENCIEACQHSDYGLAGVEFGQECCTRFNFVSSISFPRLTKFRSSRLWWWHR